MSEGDVACANKTQGALGNLRIVPVVLRIRATTTLQFDGDGTRCALLREGDTFYLLVSNMIPFARAMEICRIHLNRFFPVWWIIHPPSHCQNDVVFPDSMQCRIDQTPGEDRPRLCIQVGNTGGGTAEAYMQYMQFSVQL